MIFVVYENISFKQIIWSLNNLQTLENLNKDQEILEKFENFDAEIAVIGCLLWDNRSYEKIADFLTRRSFY